MRAFHVPGASQIARLACLILVLAPAAVQADPPAESAYYAVAMRDVQWEEKLPEKAPAIVYQQLDRCRAMHPYAQLDGEGEIYLSPISAWLLPEAARQQLFVKARAGQDVQGWFVYPKTDWSGMDRVRFTIAADKAKPRSKLQFLGAKESHFAGLLERGTPGAAWFRHHLEMTVKELGPAAAGGAASQRRGRQADSAYDLFTGGRALSENLQLDAALPLQESNERGTVPVHTIKGITIKEIDWTALLAKDDTRLDPLSASVPADQHAVFFPSFQSFIDVSDEVEKHGTPIVRAWDPRAEDEMIKDRYQRQLGVGMSAAARLLGPSLVSSVALTGSDPYFLSGTDVALIFETSQPSVLRGLLAAQITAAAAQREAGTDSGQISEVEWTNWKTPDRRMSAWLAEVGDNVVLTNSRVQLVRLIETRAGKRPALASLAEFKFFRQRYALGEEHEAAFLFLSDATIRRWCGPEWRIGGARRVLHVARMSEERAVHLDGLVRGERSPVVCSFGTLEFQTPIAELGLSRVTQTEADAYNRWRTGYESNWRWAFDPIGVRLSLEGGKLAADMTIMPLIANSSYSPLMEIVGGAKLPPGGADQHDSLVQLAMAVDTKSQLVGAARDYLTHGNKDAQGWMGGSVSLFFDQDPFWEKLLGQKPHDIFAFAHEHASEFPVGLYLEVRDPGPLPEFIKELKSAANQLAISAWKEDGSYRDQPYATFTQGPNAKLYVTWSAQGVVLTPNEGVLHRAIDRHLAKAAGETPPENPQPWLGESLALQGDARAVTALETVFGGDYAALMQARSWGNLHILNEWRSRYADQDPVQLHERFWHTRLVCPGGGEYVWNNDWKTMESTVFGHPGEPKASGAIPGVLQNMLRANFGVSLEKDGLRARAEIIRGD